MEKLQEIKQNPIKSKPSKDDNVIGINLATGWRLFLKNMGLILNNPGVITAGVLMLTTGLIMNMIAYIGRGAFFIGLMTSVEISVSLFFLLLLILFATLSVLKKQSVDGVLNIELRAGIPSWITYLIRFGIIIAVTYFYITLFILINTLMMSTHGLDANSTYSLVVKPLLFMYFVDLIGIGVMCLIYSLMTYAIGTTISVFACLTMSIGPLANQTVSSIMAGMSSATTNLNMRIYEDFGSRFYDAMKNDPYSKETILSGSKKLIDRMNFLRPMMTSDVYMINDPSELFDMRYGVNLASYYDDLLGPGFGRGYIGGLAYVENKDCSKNQNNHGNQKICKLEPVLKGTEIYKVYQDIREAAETYLSNQTTPRGSFFTTGEIEKLDLKGFVDVVIKNKPKLAPLLKYVLSQNDYFLSLFKGLKDTDSIRPVEINYMSSVSESPFTLYLSGFDMYNIDENGVNKDEPFLVSLDEAEHPELNAILYIIAQLYISQLVIPVQEQGDFNSDKLKEAKGNYEEYFNNDAWSKPIANMFNIFSHSAIMLRPDYGNDFLTDYFIKTSLNSTSSMSVIKTKNLNSIFENSFIPESRQDDISKRKNMSEFGSIYAGTTVSNKKVISIGGLWASYSLIVIALLASAYFIFLRRSRA